MPWVADRLQVSIKGGDEAVFRPSAALRASVGNEFHRRRFGKNRERLMAAGFLLFVAVVARQARECARASDEYLALDRTFTDA